MSMQRLPSKTRLSEYLAERRGEAHRRSPLHQVRDAHGNAPPPQNPAQQRALVWPAVEFYHLTAQLRSTSRWNLAPPPHLAIARHAYDLCQKVVCQQCGSDDRCCGQARSLTAAGTTTVCIGFLTLRRIELVIEYRIIDGMDNTGL